MGQGLYGDEVRTFFTTRSGLDEVFDSLGEGSVEITPPLYFVLAWLSGKAGSASELVRLPSVLLGTATVPIVYLIGRQVAGHVAGLVAAVVLAFSPFAIFYSSEGRAYATAAFFVAASTLCLLRAASSGRPVWWVGYGAAVAAALYSHYTTVFVVAAQAGWALWICRAQWRALLIVHASIALAYLPWLPSLADQKGKGFEGVLTAARLTPETAYEFPLRVVFGLASVALSELPGKLALGLFAAAALLASAAFLQDRGRSSRAPSPGATLVAITSLAAPVGLALYTLASDEELFYPAT